MHCASRVAFGSCDADTCDLTELQQARCRRRDSSTVCTCYVGCTFQETTKNSDANSRNYAYVSCRSTNLITHHTHFLLACMRSFSTANSAKQLLPALLPAVLPFYWTAFQLGRTRSWAVCLLFYVFWILLCVHHRICHHEQFESDCEEQGGHRLV